MPDSLSLNLIQYNTEWEKPDKNRAILSRWLSDIHQPSALVILPECFTTGFTQHIPEFAETMDGQTIQWMKRSSAAGGFVLAGSLFIVENGRYYNRFFFCFPGGRLEWYDKRHPFTMDGEEKCISKGNRQVIIEINGWRVCPMICYDLRFPVWSRNRGQYDLLVYTANWPASRNDVWETLLKARAIENQCYVAGVNRTGMSSAIDYCGNSLVYDAKGTLLTQKSENRDGILDINISLTELKEFRDRFPVLKDGDRFNFTL